MVLKQLIEVCTVRHDCNLPCCNCQYFGKACTHAKQILKVDKPHEYIGAISKKNIGGK